MSTDVLHIRCLQKLCIVGLAKRRGLNDALLERTSDLHRTRLCCGKHIRIVSINISDDSSFLQNHLGVADSSDGSDGTSYPLTENFTLPVPLAMGPSLLY